MKDLLDTLRGWLQTSTAPRRAAYRILKAPWLNRNPIYRHAYRKRIKRVIQRYSNFPRTVSLETSAFCNARCVMCTYPAMKRTKGCMSWSLFADAVDECARCGLETLYLSGFGEPLTDKELAAKVAYAHSKGLWTSIVTNASLLDERRTKELIKAGLDEVNISIDGFTPEVYNKIRIGLDFDVVAENIRRLSRLKLGGKPALNLEMVLIGSNWDQVAIARRDWGAIVDSIVVRQPQDWIGGIELEQEVYTPHRGRRRRFWPPCIYPFTQLSVYWDGTVPICCLDYEAEGWVGRFGKESLAQIWQDQAINHYRKRHLAQDGRLPSPCNRCSYFSVWW